VILLDVIWWLWADRRLRPLHAARWWRLLLALFMATMISTLIIPIAWPNSGLGRNGVLPMSLRMAQYLWHLIVLLPFMIGLTVVTFLDLLWRGIRWAVRKVAAQFRAGAAEPPAVPAQPQVMLTRRQLLGAAAVMLPPLALGAAVGTALWQRGRYRIRRIRVPVPDLPDALDGLTIAHVTDTHIGRFLQIEDFPRIVADTNALGADLIVQTGDLIDSGFGDLPALSAELKKLRPAVPDGLAMCLGNHDVMRDAGSRFTREIKAAGLPLLVDGALSVRVRGAGVQFLGLNWYRGDAEIRAGLERMLARRRRKDEFPILLAHHPHTFDAAIAAGLPLTLSGHSHGGQIMLTDHIGAGPILFRYWSGLYRKQGCSLVVSNGVGNWFPLRTHAPAEIVHLTLEKASA